MPVDEAVAYALGHDDDSEASFTPLSNGKHRGDVQTSDLRG
jgi:hypothetical protein